MQIFMSLDGYYDVVALMVEFFSEIVKDKQSN